MDISRVKMCLNKKVLYDNSEYILSGCIIRFDEKKGKYFYQAELKPIISTNSLIYSKLEDVKEILKND